MLRKKLRRRDMLAFFERLPATKVGMEACRGEHYWVPALRRIASRCAASGTLKQAAPQKQPSFAPSRTCQGACRLGRIFSRRVLFSGHLLYFKHFLSSLCWLAPGDCVWKPSG